MSKIKYCIWDVGQVMYEYSLEPLHAYCQEHTTDVAKFEANKGKFSYNEYMKGNTTWDELCQELADFYALPIETNTKIDFNKAFHQGVGKYFEETRKTQEHLKSVGIENCILSNALPILAGSNDNMNLIKPENVFTSFELGMLKPDVNIYKTVIEKLGCKPQEIIFVDDKSKNVKAAQSIGINGIVFDASTIENNVKSIVNGTNLFCHKLKNKEVFL